MKIKEISSLNLSETTFKLSPKSITVKDSNNKTKGIINDVKRLLSLPNNQKFSIQQQYKVNLLPYANNLYVENESTLYYIIDQQSHEVAMKLYNNGYTDEYNKIQNIINTLKQLNINILFLKLI